RVNTALDGEDGLKKAGDLTPDIIFLDIRLPKMDGLEVLRKLRAQEKTRDIPVIILSNYDEEDLVARGLRLGAHEYLIKARTTPTSLSEGIEDWLKEELAAHRATRASCSINRSIPSVSRRRFCKRIPAR